jgi:anti-sigma regulatory factor (Ser/Thr protein kinase)
LSAIYVAGRSEALVGGDWYDAFPVDDGRTIVSIGDVEGSGLEAALAMVTVRQTIRALAMVQPDPSVMLAGANRALFAQHPQRYVTAFVGILDPVTRRCTYANAGHPPPMVRHADGRIELAGGRDFPIGLVRDHTFEIHDVAMSEGAVMLLYTDGLTEATHDVVAGEERLEGLLTGLDPATTENIAYAIYEGMPQSRDDVAILGVVVGKLPPFRRWRFDPRYEDLSVRVRAALRDEILQIGFSTEQITNLEAIFAELVANALRHAPGAIEVILQSQRDSVVLHMLDRGPGFSANGTLPNDLFSESGRGLFLVRHFSDDFVVERRAGKGSHTRVTLLNTRKETQ